MRFMLKLAVISFLVLFFVQPVSAADEDDGSSQLLTITEQAVHEAEEGEIAEVKEKLEAFHEKWEAVEGEIREEAPEAYEAIEAAYAKASALVNSGDPEAAEVEEAVEALEEAVEGYTAGAEMSKDGAPGSKVLLGLSGELLEAKELISEENWEEAKAEYGEFHEGWEAVEGSVRSANMDAYEQIETNMGLVSAALNAEPPQAEEAKESLGKLIASIEEYANGEAAGAKEGGQDIGTLLHILDETQTAIGAGNSEKAKNEMAEFITVWPRVEGMVKTQSSEAYTETENNMTKALSLLSSNPAKLDQASEVISGMEKQLQPLAGETNYSFWDAAIILLREGLEIILILAALLSFLNKTNNSDKRPWIWGGASAGVVASVALAFILSSALTVAAAGEERELLEGITGLIAVVVMFTVGSWLHNKSNLASWNNYIKDKVGTALARGSLWSLAGVAFLTVVREGAETIIFYLGMAADISTSQLTLGIVVALAILLALAFAIIKFSIKLPVKWLFLGITVLIYYIAFKFTGESVHALQVVNAVPAHPAAWLPSISWIGMYPTWETTSTQLLLLILIAGQTALVQRRKAVARRTSEQANENEASKQVIQSNR
ncbi:MAG TPA: FTR1 family protein [Bacillales bacterium]|nr:FTR1 family protein [Bacillales bacterium]